MERLLTVEEVAALLAVPPATLYRWRYSGTGPPAMRVGKYLRYSPSQLENWLSELTVPGSAGAPARAS